MHCEHHSCWVKTRGMCLDARADFGGKKLVFSQTNSHLLSGRGEPLRGAKRRHVSNYRSTLCLPAAASMLDAFAKTNQKKTKCNTNTRRKGMKRKNLNYPDWTAYPLSGCLGVCFEMFEKLYHPTITPERAKDDIALALMRRWY